MKENKNNEVVKYLLENYDIKNANDIAYALKDMFKDTIQTLMNAEFEPQIVPKNKRDISGIEEKVINLYGKGLSTREISDSIEDIYGVQLSATMISNITDAVLAEKRVSILMGDQVEPRKEWIEENVEFSLEDDYKISNK